LAKVEELLRDCSDVTKINEDEKIVRLSYRKKNISEPLLSELTVEFAVVPNIIFADIEIVQEAPIGGTVAILSGKEKALSAAIDWLRQKDVGVEVLAG
jgi:D-methionine transport system ATP-binding protein